MLKYLPWTQFAFQKNKQKQKHNKTLIVNLGQHFPLLFIYGNHRRIQI